MKRILVSLLIPFFTLVFWSKFSSVIAGKGENPPSSFDQNIPALRTEKSFPETQCIHPKTADVEKCAAIEENILQSTVQLQFRSWAFKSENDFQIYDSTSLATAIDGRFLVTHNHYETPLSIFRQSDNQEIITSLKIKNARNQVIYTGLLDNFYIHHAGEEVLVLGLIDPDSPLWLEELGIKSPKLASDHQVNLLPGTEIAQIDWDGHNIRVDWTVIDEVKEFGSKHKVVLDDAVKIGASGGGIYYNGLHIGNTSALSIKRNNQGRIADLRSTATLNDAALLEIENSAVHLTQ